MSLGVVLIVVTMSFVATTVLAGGVTMALNLSAHQVQAGSLQNAATSVVEQAIAACMGDTAFHQSIDLLIDGARVRLTFDAAQAASWGVPRSLNNYLNAHAQTVDHQLVPQQSIYLVATAESAGRSRHVGAIVYIPAYPYAISSSGTINLIGCDISGVTQPVLPGQTVAPNMLVPGSTVSDGQTFGSLTLQGSTVSGDAQSCGTVIMDRASQIGGAVRNDAAPQPLPDFSPQQYDPAVLGGGILTISGQVGSPVISGFYRCDGDLHVTGALQLSNGSLYVNGNLQVDGGLHGLGSLVVTGTTTIAQDVNLSAPTQVALLSGGDVTIAGGGQDSSFLSGVVFTAGSLYAKDLTLYGACISAPSSGSATIGTVQMQHVRAVHVDAMTRLDFSTVQTFPGLFHLGMPAGDIVQDPSPTAHPAVGFYDATGRLRSVGEPALVPTDVETFQIRRSWNATTKQVYFDLVTVGFAGVPPIITGSSSAYEGNNLSQSLQQLYIANSNWMPVPMYNNFAGVANAYFNSANNQANLTFTHLVHVDPNDFLSIEQKMRMMVWRAW
jgi:cytoskeletal protein CcmA (bactofilin family)